MMGLYGNLAGEALARYLSPAHDVGALGLGENGADGPRSGLRDELTLAETVLAEFAGEIVQRLFAAGLHLASARAVIGDGPVRDRVAACADELDSAIVDIRATVFGPRVPQASRTNLGP